MGTCAQRTRRTLGLAIALRRTCRNRNKRNLHRLRRSCRSRMARSHKGQGRRRCPAFHPFHPSSSRQLPAFRSLPLHQCPAFPRRRFRQSPSSHRCQTSLRPTLPSLRHPPSRRQCRRMPQSGQERRQESRSGGAETYLLAYATAVPTQSRQMWPECAPLHAPTGTATALTPRSVDWVGVVPFRGVR